MEVVSFFTDLSVYFEELDERNVICDPVCHCQDVSSGELGWQSCYNITGSASQYFIPVGEL